MDSLPPDAEQSPPWMSMRPSIEQWLTRALIEGWSLDGNSGAALQTEM